MTRETEDIGSSSEKLTWEKRKQRKTMKGKPIIPRQACPGSLHFVTYSLFHTLTSEATHENRKKLKETSSTTKLSLCDPEIEQKDKTVRGAKAAACWVLGLYAKTVARKLTIKTEE